MTCREKLKLDHPDWMEIDLIYHIHNDCPSAYGYLDDPDCCAAECAECWSREIPGTINAVCLDPKDVTKLDKIITDATEKEKENMPITRKTKQELIDEISALNKELEATSRIDKYTAFADEMYSMYQAFVNSGFSDERAYELVKLLIMSQLRNINE